MINITIFSKDRACQLDLLLRSIKRFTNLPKNKINIIYTSSNDNFEQGYIKLKKENTKFIFHKELGNFKHDVIEKIKIKNEYTMWLVDDDFFKETFNLNDSLNILNNEKVLCSSLRMHPGIRYCYTANIETPAPNISKNGLFGWEGLKGDWGYPMSVDGHIFRTKDILPLVKKINFSNPNTFEGNLAGTKINKPLMHCFNKSKILNNPANKVQNVNNNRHGNITAKELNKKYLDGYKISMNNLIGIETPSPHFEIPFILEKY